MTQTVRNATFDEKLTALKKRYEKEGLSLAEFARQNGYTVNEVYRVTGGFTNCLRGKSHEIAVKLGLK